MKRNCSVSELISLLGKRWTFPIIHSLKRNNLLSYNSIGRLSNNKINPRALALSLNELIRLGIVKKERKGSRIFYSLTENGEKLSHLTKSFKSWCHMNDMDMPSSCDLNCLGCEFH